KFRGELVVSGRETTLAGSGCGRTRYVAHDAGNRSLRNPGGGRTHRGRGRRWVPWCTAAAAVLLQGSLRRGPIRILFRGNSALRGRSIEALPLPHPSGNERTDYF